jgi:hypothetical protein
MAAAQFARVELASTSGLACRYAKGMPYLPNHAPGKKRPAIV